MPWRRRITNLGLTLRLNQSKVVVGFIASALVDDEDTNQIKQIVLSFKDKLASS